MKKGQVLRVGTDCSGIEAPIQALRQLGIPFRHVFSSEIDKYCIQSIKANYEPEILFGDSDGPFPEGDITKRRIEDVPDIDLYVCGFPCQPYSAAGKRKGFGDDRSGVIWTCLDLIEAKLPKWFILENVSGLISKRHEDEWSKIKYRLSELPHYIQYKVLNPKDYGHPQNRPRIFIVGNLNSDIKWPIRVNTLPPLIDYVDRTNTTACKWGMCYEFPNINNDVIFIDLKSVKRRALVGNPAPNGNKYSPCLTRKNSLWCVPYHRYATYYEHLALQGFPLDFKVVVSVSRLKDQIGNSMNVTVIAKVIESICM